ncbi:MAG: hypothetical protein D6748_03980 [Calditrichaeota bacterium]|nr:MAG: hypothetical protein D6748_03980 [Calditrichota bacterium]
MSIFKQITRLAQHSAIYAISNAFQKLSGLILLPVYTNLNYIPSRSEFGDYVMIFTFIAFMYFVYSYGMDSAMLRYFFLGKRDRKIVFSSTFFILLSTSVLTTLMIVVFSPQLGEVLLKSPTYAPYVRLAGLILFFDALGNLPYLILRAEEKSIQFTLFKLFRFLLELGLNVFFVVVLRKGVMGILYTSLTASIINLLVMLPIAFRYFTLRVDFSLAREMLAFGLPFLPHGIAYTTIEMVDRFIVPAVLGKDALGLYGASYKFGAILLLLVNAFRNAWQPFFLNIAEQANAKEIYSRVLTYFVVASGVIVLLATFFIRDILTFHFFDSFYLLGKEYWSGISIIPIILLSYCFYGIYVILTPGFYITGRSKYMIVFTGSGAAINILVNLILLPVMYIYGAAMATLLSYATMAITIYLISQRIYPIPIEGMRILKMGLLIFGFMGVYYLWDWSFLLRVGFSILSILLSYFWVLNSRERLVLKQQLSRLYS